MFRLFSITILLLLPLQSIASVAYTVRLAVYNNADSLQTELNKLSPAIRKTIEVTKRGKQHVACSVQTDKKETLEKLLPSYKKVFPDAFISSYQTTEKNTTEVHNTKTVEVPTQTPQTEKKPEQTIETNTTVKTAEANETSPQIEPKIIYTPYSRKIVNPTKKNIALYDRLRQKTLYLSAYGAERGLPNVLIHVAFFDKEVIYTPISGTVSDKRERYTVDDNKLYISDKDRFDPEVYSTLQSITSDYYLISNWVGKSKVNTLRYYFDLEKAEAYLETLR